MAHEKTRTQRRNNYTPNQHPKDTAKKWSRFIQPRISQRRNSKTNNMVRRKKRQRSKHIQQFRHNAWTPMEPTKIQTNTQNPFHTHRKEIDQLIAGCGQKTATFLQILKETGARCGEAWQLQWTDIDFQNRILTITPEKGSNPRQFKISMTLISMLNALPREQQKLWTSKLKTIRRGFQRSRKRVANSTQNPRILKISFHTLRHWKATTEYHKTKDILHVMRVLGHKNITNTLRYTQLIQTDDDEFITKVAKTVEQACKLIEAGYEYVTEFQDQGVKIFRKRK